MRRDSGGRNHSTMGIRGSGEANLSRVSLVHMSKIQYQGTAKARGEDKEEKEEGKGEHGFRQWSRQLRYQLRVQAVARNPRVKE